MNASISPLSEISVAVVDKTKSVELYPLDTMDCQAVIPHSTGLAVKPLGVLSLWT